MKRKELILIIFLIVGIESTFGQSIIQSTCLNDTSILYPDIIDFSYEIALAEMRDENHYYHDSILVPQPFIDSIKNYVSAYHNAIGLSDSIIDYKTFYSYNLEFGEILITFDTSSNYFYRQDNELIITNDTLAHYIDSLKLIAQSWSDTEISLSDTSSVINIYGDFNLFYDISKVSKVDLILAVVDMMPCYKSRSGDFKDNTLKIVLSEVNYCDPNSYSYNWIYNVNNDCQIAINSIPTSIDENTNGVNIFIYPNPFDNILYLDSEESLMSIRFMGLDGKTYLQSYLRNDKILNTSGLRTGLYLIEIKTDKAITYRKMIKK